MLLHFLKETTSIISIPIVFKSLNFVFQIVINRKTWSLIYYWDFLSLINEMNEFLSLSKDIFWY
jgi:hypothetical protein